MTTSDFDRDAPHVAHLLEALGLPATLSDPEKTYGKQTGADVEAQLPARRIGIQVTVYHGQEGQRGGGLRAQEGCDTKKGRIRTYAVPADATAGLTKRFRAKLSKAKRYTFREFDEPWLLIPAFLRAPGAVAATAVAPFFISPEWLERRFGEALRGSIYKRVYFHVQLWPALYEWSPEQGWRAVRESREPRNAATDRGGGYVVRTGEARWSVGYLQAGPLSDIGLYCFVLDRGLGGAEWNEVAYTREPEHAEMIVAALYGDMPKATKPRATKRRSAKKRPPKGRSKH